MDRLDEQNAALEEAVELLIEKEKFSKKIGKDRYKLTKSGLKGKWREVGNHNAFIVEPEGKALFLPGQDIDPEDVKKRRSVGTKAKGIFNALRKLNVHIGKKQKD